MSDSGDNGGSFIWTALKVLAIIVVSFLLLRFIFRITMALLPLLVLAGVVYLVYRLLTGSKGEVKYVESSDTLLLESDSPSDDALDRRFKELEAEEARVNRKLKDLDLD